MLQATVSFHACAVLVVLSCYPCLPVSPLYLLCVLLPLLSLISFEGAGASWLYRMLNPHSRVPILPHISHTHLLVTTSAATPSVVPFFDRSSMWQSPQSRFYRRTISLVSPILSSLPLMAVLLLPCYILREACVWYTFEVLLFSNPQCRKVKLIPFSYTDPMTGDSG